MIPTTEQEREFRTLLENTSGKMIPGEITDCWRFMCANKEWLLSLASTKPHPDVERLKRECFDEAVNGSDSDMAVTSLVIDYLAKRGLLCNAAANGREVES